MHAYFMQKILLFIFGKIRFILLLVVLVLTFISFSRSLSINVFLISSSHLQLIQGSMQKTQLQNIILQVTLKTKQINKSHQNQNQQIQIQIQIQSSIDLLKVNNNQQSKQMDKIVNIINLAGWLYLQFHVGIHLFVDPQSFATSDITFDVNLLRFIQTFQIMDIILIIIGLSKGSIVGAFFQILGRLVVAWGFIEPETNNSNFAIVVIIWALADTNRYLYYLFKNHPLTSLLRYNSFLILYPIGVFGEMLVINDYIKRHSEWLTQSHILGIRVIQASICFGLVFLYVYMLKMRKIHYSKKVQAEDTTSQSEQRQRSRSPRAKRD